MPIDLDGNGRLTICANVEKQNVTPGYKNWKGVFTVSTYDLDGDTFRVSFGRLKPFDEITVKLP